MNNATSCFYCYINFYATLIYLEFSYCPSIDVFTNSMGAVVMMVVILMVMVMVVVLMVVVVAVATAVVLCR